VNSAFPRHFLELRHFSPTDFSLVIKNLRLLAQPPPFFCPPRFLLLLPPLSESMSVFMQGSSRFLPSPLVLSGPISLQTVCPSPVVEQEPENPGLVSPFFSQMYSLFQVFHPILLAPPFCGFGPSPFTFLRPRLLAFCSNLSVAAPYCSV